MKLTPDKLISEIVAKDYRAAKVLMKHDISFCCTGRTNLAQASQEKGIAVEQLMSEIESMQKEQNKGPDYNAWPIDFLADYIEKTHHRYVRKTVPLLKQYTERIHQVHGAQRPELIKIKYLFNESAVVLGAHMKEEEKVLFPLFRDMAKGKEVNGELIRALIHNLMEEHENEEEQFNEIAQLSNQYTPPEDACNTYRVTYGLLSEYDQDLKLHTHLENNILFTKALNLLDN